VNESDHLTVYAWRTPATQDWWDALASEDAQEAIPRELHELLDGARQAVDLPHADAIQAFQWAARLPGWRGAHTGLGTEDGPQGVIRYRDQVPAVYPAATQRPLYRKIEFCRDPETLWRKIESWWDWLGVYPDGQFVVGYPKRKAHLEIDRPGPIKWPGADGQYRVRVKVPLVAGWYEYWLPTQAEATDKYEEIVALQGKGGGQPNATLMRVQELDGDRVLRESLIVARLPNYEGRSRRSET